LLALRFFLSGAVPIFVVADLQVGSSPVADPCGNMELSENTKALKQLRKTSWKFQQTFQTPPSGQNLSSFFRTIVSATPSPGIGSFTIGQAVIFPDHLTAFFCEKVSGSGLSIRHDCEHRKP